MWIIVMGDDGEQMFWGTFNTKEEAQECLTNIEDTYPDQYKQFTFNIDSVDAGTDLLFLIKTYKDIEEGH